MYCMCTDILPACIVCTVPMEIRGDIGASGAGVTCGCELGIKPGSSRIAASALNHWAISPAVYFELRSLCSPGDLVLTFLLLRSPECWVAGCTAMPNILTDADSLPFMF